MNASNSMVDTSAWTSSLPDDVQKAEQRFILAGIEQLIVVFPSNVIADISIVDRSSILNLPFYDPIIWGIIHCNGQNMPLVSLRQVFGVSTGLMREKLTVVRLNSEMSNLAGLGLIVDTTLGTRSTNQLKSDLDSAEMSIGESKSESRMRLFKPEMLGDRFWQPQRWQASVI